MQRKQIKIGEAYAVHGSRSTSRTPTPVKATVVSFDGEYQRAIQHSLSGATRPAYDGIVVRFDEPMVRDYDTFRPLSGYTPDRYQQFAIEEARGKAVTEAVLAKPQMVVEPWAEYAERIERHAAWSREQNENTDALGDKVEPRLLAAEAALNAQGIKFTTATAKRKGAKGQRTVGATISLSLDQIETLLARAYMEVEA